jgi:crotonobetainyl-CoA hydratase
LAALGGGLLQRLPRQVAMKDAMWMVLTAQQVDAVEAQQMRLVNRIVPGEKLAASVRALAQELLKGAPLALQASKQVMLQSLAVSDLASTMNENYELAQRMLASQDAVEGPRAFSEKRAPNWTGT